MAANSAADAAVLKKSQNLTEAMPFVTKKKEEQGQFVVVVAVVEEEEEERHRFHRQREASFSKEETGREDLADLLLVLVLLEKTCFQK